MRRAPISNRSGVRRLALARLVSFTGGGAAAIALAVTIFEQTGSAGWVAATLVASHGVQVGAGMFTATLSDRFPRRTVMIVCEVAGGMCYCAMALAGGPAALLGLAVIASLVASPFNASSAAAMPNLVGPVDLGWANSMVAGGRSLGMTLGPALGGAVAATAGAPTVFVVNAVSFFVSAAVIATVKGRFSAERAGPDRHSGVYAGLAFVWYDPILRRMMFAEAVLVLGLGLMQVARVPLAETLGIGSFGLGLLTGLWGAGLLIGSFAGRFLDARREPVVFLVGLAGVAAASLAIGFSPWFSAIVGLHLFVGLADSLDLVAGQGIRQRRTPDAVLSRVLAANSALVVLAQMVGYAVAGVALEIIRPRGIYLACGVVVALSAILSVPVLRGRPSVSPAA